MFRPFPRRGRGRPRGNCRSTNCVSERRTPDSAGSWMRDPAESEFDVPGRRPADCGPDGEPAKSLIEKGRQIGYKRAMVLNPYQLVFADLWDMAVGNGTIFRPVCEKPLTPARGYWWVHA